MNILNKTCGLLAFAAMSLPAAAEISIPQAPVVTYGLVRDKLGNPMTAAHCCTLELVKDADRGGRVYAQSVVGDSSMPGMNYRLSLEIDSSAIGGRKNAVTNGVRMFIRATVLDTITGKTAEATLSPVSAFATPVQGTMQRLDFTTGTDIDGDGMPDDWERWMLGMAGEDDSDDGVWAFRPDADADGDGMTNYQEYLAGTDPFLDTDILKIMSFERVPGTDRAMVTFTTAADRKYRLVMTESLKDPVWTPLATANAVDGELGYTRYNGDGFERTVYVAVQAASAFIRVAVD